MRVQSLGWEESLEKEMATHSSILAWKTLWAEEPGGLQPMGPLTSQTKRLLSDQMSPSPCQRSLLFNTLHLSCKRVFRIKLEEKQVDNWDRWMGTYRSTHPSTD